MAADKRKATETRSVPYPCWTDIAAEVGQVRIGTASSVTSPPARDWCELLAADEGASSRVKGGRTR